MKTNGIVYDAASILGFGEASNDPLPPAAAGEVVIRVGAWSVLDLRICETVPRDCLTWDQDCHWSRMKLAPGIYRLRVPVPDSNGKTSAEQQKFLLPGEEVTPVALVAAALLCHLRQTSKDLLNGHWTRCAVALPCGVTIAVGGRGVQVSHCLNDDRYDRMWVSGARNA